MNTEFFTPLRIALIAIVAIITAQIATLAYLGQPYICECGVVKIWEGVVQSAGNSQHLMDWYTPSHVLHGFLFYLLLWLVFPRLSVIQRLAIAVGIEVAWEIFENTPMVIDHYRQQALAQGYTGDSILNSVSDTFAMMAGFFIAWRLPVAVTILVAVALEVFVGLSIRDNLTLNILGLVHVFPAITEWQNGQ